MTLSDPVSLSIIVPAYNEEILLRGTVEHLVEVAPQHADEIEIIIVDDGSTDSTPAIADHLADKYDIVTAYHCNLNKGFGATVRYGIKQASKKFVMYTPVDYHFTSGEFDIYFTLIRYADIVIGYRRARRKELGFYPRLVSACYHIVVNILFQLNFYDVNWIHLYRRDQIDRYLGRSDGVFFLAENLIRSKKMGLKVLGVDVDFTDREAGVATGVRTNTIAKTIIELAKFLCLSALEKMRNRLN